MRIVRVHLPRTLTLSLTAVLTLSACASSAEPTAAEGGEQAETLSVQASFYPLQYVTERVGGDLVEVESLTPSGAEPHDVELSPAAVEELRTADAVVYLSGFQPAVDEAVDQAVPENTFDAAAAGVEGEDPHFWLDPERLAAVATAVGRELGEVDPDNAAAYEANAEQLSGELAALDEEFAEGLATCERNTIVVSHDAYGYLAEKYGLEQVAVAGLEPDTEPSPARLAEVGEVVEAEGVTTVFSESLVNPKVAETLAAEHGVGMAVLDPVEGLVDESADYQQVMRENLEVLRAALDCA